MTELKKGQAVNARTIRATSTVPGKMIEIEQTAKGAWVTVQPNAEGSKAFKTRPALCTPT